MTPDLPVIQKTYDLLLWTVGHTVKFPRAYRFSLGDRLERQLYGILEGLLHAKFSKERAAILDRINLDLEVLRFQIRLARDLKCISVTSYGFAATELNEVGKMVGGGAHPSGYGFSLWRHKLHRVTVWGVLRGGSWNNNARNARSAYRNNNTPDKRNNNIGFRLVSAVPPSSMPYLRS